SPSQARTAKPISSALTTPAGRRSSRPTPRRARSCASCSPGSSAVVLPPPAIPACGSFHPSSRTPSPSGAAIGVPANESHPRGLASAPLGRGKTSGRTVEGCDRGCSIPMYARLNLAYDRLLTGCGLLVGLALAALAVLISLDVLLRNLGLFSSGALLEVTEYT